MDLTLDVWTCDVGAAASSPEAWMEHVAGRVEESWRTGAELVLFPEFCWMGLEPFAAQTDALRGLAALFWDTLWPDLHQRLTVAGKCAVLGSVPWVHPTTGTVHNRVPIVSSGTVRFQDKLCLTPWEKAFAGGDAIHLWDFGPWKLGVLVCLDIEIPEHAAALRGQGVDLLLVPSATESVLGTERIARCASARAVELGCFVAVAHLTGKACSVLVDENIGRVSCYAPSQSPFAERTRIDEGPLHETGFHCRRFLLDLQLLRRLRRLRAETNPARCRPDVPAVRAGTESGIGLSPDINHG